MPRGDKSSYTDMHKRKVAHIEDGHENRPYAAGKGGEIRYQRVHG